MGSKTLVITIQEIVDKLIPTKPDDLHIMGAFFDTQSDKIHSASDALVVVMVSDTFETQTPLKV